MRQDFWSEDEEKLARELMDAGAPERDYIEKLGRSKTSAASHFYYCRNRASWKVRYDERYSKSARQVSRENIKQSFWPDSAVLEDAQRRRLAPRSLTATICGDPAPGQSALDQKRAHG